MYFQLQRLTVENSQFNNNVASLGGGAIFGAYEGTVTVSGSKFDSNTATAGNDERGAGAIATWGGIRTTVTDSVPGVSLDQLNPTELL